jgi:hypothetical protein
MFTPTINSTFARPSTLHCLMFDDECSNGGRLATPLLPFTVQAFPCRGCACFARVLVDRYFFGTKCRRKATILKAGSCKATPMPINSRQRHTTYPWFRGRLLVYTHFHILFLHVAPSIQLIRQVPRNALFIRSTHSGTRLRLNVTCTA